MGFSRWFWLGFSGSFLAAIQRISEGISMSIVVTSISNRPVSMNSVPCKSISISLGISIRVGFADWFSIGCCFSISGSLFAAIQRISKGVSMRVVVASVPNRPVSITCIPSKSISIGLRISMGLSIRFGLSKCPHQEEGCQKDELHGSRDVLLPIPAQYE